MQLFYMLRVFKSTDWMDVPKVPFSTGEPLRKYRGINKIRNCNRNTILTEHI